MSLGYHEETGRPTWRGMIVPYIARWSAERIAQGDPDDDLAIINFNGTIVTAYRTEVDAAMHRPNATTQLVADALMDQRDEYGLLWHRDRDLPGHGEPEFAMVQTARQRRCMIDGVCQVCGKERAPDEDVTFLEHGTGPLGLKPGEPYTTVTAPTCRRCIKFVLQQCPAHRNKTRSLITARKYTPAMVVADLWDERGVVVGSAEHVQIGHEGLFRAVVKQLIVAVIDYTEQPVSLADYQ